MREEGAQKRGIVLVLMAGLIVLLLMVGLAFLRIASAGAHPTLAQARARLAAHSGLEYAADRLWARSEPYVSGSQMQTRGDDWTCRESDPARPLAIADNPSYAHGDLWQEAIPYDGRYVAGGDAFDPALHDRDGDGRFLGWSGRLRGAGTGDRFSLRVQSAGGLVCVNSGELGSPLADHDLDGDLNREDPDYATDLNFAWDDEDDDGLLNVSDPDYTGPLGNGVPDWRDPDFVGNLHLVNLLNNLGAVLQLSTTHTEPYAAGAAGARLGFVEVSDLGRQVVAQRPREGWGAVESLRAFLEPADFEAASPYLSTEGEIVPVSFPAPSKLDAFRNYIQAPEVRYEFHARIDLARASKEVIHAALRNLSASGTYHMNPPSALLPITLEGSFVRIGEEEARLLAEKIATVPRPPLWTAFLGTLARFTGYAQDPFLTGADTQKYLKQDLILAAFDANACAPDPTCISRMSLDVARELPPDPQVGNARSRPRRISRYQLQGPLNTVPYDDAGENVASGTGDVSRIVQGIPSRRTTEFTLSPRFDSFSIESMGWLPQEGSGARGARCETHGNLTFNLRAIHLTGQQDFEMMGVSAADPWRYPGGEAYADGSGMPVRSGIQSHPRFPLSSYTAASVNPGATPIPSDILASHRYPRAIGDLRLSAHQWTYAELEPYAFTLPFNEDGDPSDPKTCYDTGQWTDNVGDPAVRSAVAPMPALANHGSQDPPDAWETFHQGLAYGPCGPRANPAVWKAQDVNPPAVDVPNCLKVRWEGPAAGTPCPWERSAMSGVAGVGAFVRGTLECWYPGRGGEDLAPGYHNGQIIIWYDDKSVAWTEFLRITFIISPTSPQEMIEIRTNGVGGQTYTTIPVTPWTAGSGWCQMAFVFWDDASTDDQKSYMGVYADGSFIGALPVSLRSDHDPFAADAGKMTLTVTGFSLDDIFLHADLPTMSDIRARAQRNRYVSTPTPRYTSARFTFDPARFPRGAFLRGAAWDAWIPINTGATLSFQMISYNEAGAEVDRRAFLSSVSSAPQRHSFPEVIRGCRSTGFVMEIPMSSTSWPQVPSVGTQHLRDTPVLDEFSILYSAGPRWISWGER